MQITLLAFVQLSSSAEAGKRRNSARGPSKLSSVNWGRARHEAVNSSSAGPVDVRDRLPAPPNGEERAIAP